MARALLLKLKMFQPKQLRLSVLALFSFLWVSQVLASNLEVSLSGLACGRESEVSPDHPALVISEPKQEAPSFCHTDKIQTGERLSTLLKWSYKNVGEGCLRRIWIEIEHLVMVDQSQRSGAYIDDISMMKDVWNELSEVFHKNSNANECTEESLQAKGRLERFSQLLYQLQDRYVSDNQNLFMLMEDLEYEKPFVFSAVGLSPFLIWLILRKPQTVREVAKLGGPEAKAFLEEAEAIAAGAVSAVAIQTEFRVLRKMVQSFVSKTLKRVATTVSPSRWGGLLARSTARSASRVTVIHGGGEVIGNEGDNEQSLQNFIALTEKTIDESPILQVMGEDPYFNNYQDMQFTNVLLAGAGGTVFSIGTEMLSLFSQNVRAVLGVLGGGSPGLGLFALTVGSTIYLEKTMDSRRFDFWNWWTYHDQARLASGLNHNTSEAPSEIDDYLNLSRLYHDYSNELVYQMVLLQTKLAPELSGIYRNWVCTLLSQPAGIKPPPDESRFEAACELPSQTENKDVKLSPSGFNPLISPLSSNTVKALLSCQRGRAKERLLSLSSSFSYRLKELSSGIDLASKNPRFSSPYFAPILTKLKSYRDEFRKLLEVDRRLLSSWVVFSENRGFYESVIAGAYRDKKAYLDLHDEFKCPLINPGFR